MFFNTPAELQQILAVLTLPGAAVELAMLAALLLLSWLLVRLMRGPTPTTGTSIWFGRHLVDGVLFPTLALALAFAARRTLPELGLPLTLFRLAVPVLTSLVVIRLSVRVLSAAFPASHLMRVVERTISWLAWGAMVLWVTGVLPIVLRELDDISWKMGGHNISLRTLIEGSLSAAFVLVLALWVSAALESRLLDGVAGAQLSLRKAAANALRALLMFVGLLLALSAVGIDLTALSVLGGALGVGIGFGLQKLAANYVSGFVILAERSLRIGDMVRVADFEGRISDITTRYTVIRSLSGREAIVPNETLITTMVENLSLADTRVLVSTTVTVAYGTDVASLRDRMATVIATVPRVADEPAPAVHLTAFGTDGLELTASFWIRDPENGQGNVKGGVNLAILELLEREGVSIPYPQRVVRVLAESKQEVTAEASVLAGPPTN
ncbi:mechanosensitive ion channel-like protein [Sphaerotilus hippei]|uniref:Mechanosensitive ion channel-like protein n=1 Tax=Sphaerotilus hippei TaxID=744406 RepID=A0A318GZB1_9BURK|nr:mechanosensitive ion channel domain-containing protein [Sphaerotilus hippei]PXW95552.1 mechanosensitive ion channel-like protein [Sphaerotilus hippei]